jgi:hypothetical protein
MDWVRRNLPWFFSQPAGIPTDTNDLITAITQDNADELYSSTNFDKLLEREEQILLLDIHSPEYQALLSSDKNLIENAHAAINARLYGDMWEHMVGETAKYGNQMDKHVLSVRTYQLVQNAPAVSWDTMLGSQLRDVLLIYVTSVCMPHLDAYLEDGSDASEVNEFISTVHHLHIHVPKVDVYRIIQQTIHDGVATKAYDFSYLDKFISMCRSQGMDEDYLDKLVYDDEYLTMTEKALNARNPDEKMVASNLTYLYGHAEKEADEMAVIDLMEKYYTKLMAPHIEDYIANGTSESETVECLQTLATWPDEAMVLLYADYDKASNLDRLQNFVEFSKKAGWSESRLATLKHHYAKHQNVVRSFTALRQHARGKQGSRADPMITTLLKSPDVLGTFQFNLNTWKETDITRENYIWLVERVKHVDKNTLELRRYMVLRLHQMYDQAVYKRDFYKLVAKITDVESQINNVMQIQDDDDPLKYKPVYVRPLNIEELRRERSKLVHDVEELYKYIKTESGQVQLDGEYFDEKSYVEKAKSEALQARLNKVAAARVIPVAAPLVAAPLAAAGPPVGGTPSGSTRTRGRRSSSRRAGI